MADEQADEKRLVTIEGKIDRLSVAVDERFASVDQRFAAVDAAFVEQREYTEFAFERLSREMKGGFDEVARGFAGVSRGFAEVSAGFAEVFGGFAEVFRRFDRLEGKLDGFIDTQSKANELVERRLDAQRNQDE